MEAAELRSVFLRHFTERGHTLVPSASLIATDPTLLFTVAGMVPFKAYFAGEETPPYTRAVSIQKCFRVPDIELIGTTSRHLTFFEMLGNFSFGDYFKAEAIEFAWSLITGGFGLDPARLWVTVHESDDEAADLWPAVSGLDPGRVRRLGEDNFWTMGPVGPCGPSSEIFFDKGPEHGDGGGPGVGADERYVEFWNLVFMTFDRHEDGTLDELPKKNIDTGSGLERTLSVVNGKDSVFATDLFAPLLEAAQSLTGRRFGDDDESDIGLRRIAEHGRSMTMLVADGVLPTNEGRGYVLRRVIRRAVLTARRLGAQRPLTDAVVAATIEKMGDAYPVLIEDRDLIASILAREEAAFDRTLRVGLSLLEAEVSSARETSGTTFSGETAFRLHDTHGFPIELTEEVVHESGLTVDRAAFDRDMTAQRERARANARMNRRADDAAYRALLDASGPSEFVGRDPARYHVEATVVGVLTGDDGTSEVFLDATPFYAESGGQVGDVGSIVTETGRLTVTDTQNVTGGLIAHRGAVSGEILVDQAAVAAINGPRRDSIRRNHTATHLLHAALRHVLGDHVRQQGSLVAADRLRFDFSHDTGLHANEWNEITTAVNDDILTNPGVQTVVVNRKEAEEMGAIAFFGDKYGDRVRVVRAGPHSLEFCGGTHVHQLGDIGQIQVVSESSIGANTRRIEAVSGLGAVARAQQLETTLGAAAALLKTAPEDVPTSIERLLDRQRELEKNIGALRQSQLAALSSDLAAGATEGTVVARVDDLGADQLRQLAQDVLRHGQRAVVIAGVSPEGKVSLVAATDGEVDATSLVRASASHVDGSGGGSRTLAMAGGKNAAGLDRALGAARDALG